MTIMDEWKDIQDIIWQVWMAKKVASEVKKTEMKVRHWAYSGNEEGLTEDERLVCLLCDKIVNDII